MNKFLNRSLANRNVLIQEWNRKITSGFSVKKSESQNVRHSVEYLQQQVNNFSKSRSTGSLFKLKPAQLETLNDNAVTINDKQVCLDEFKKFCDVLLDDIDKSSWLLDLRTLGVKTSLFSNERRLQYFKQKYFESPLYQSIIRYVNGHFDEFTLKEKAMLFRVIALLNDQSPSMDALLRKFEIDYYNRVDECTLIDYYNYKNAINNYSNSILHFYATSTDKAFQKALALLDAESNPIVNDPIDQLNARIHEHQNSSLLVCLSVFKEFKILNNDALNAIYRRLFLHNYKKLNEERDLNTLSTVLGLFIYNFDRLPKNIRHTGLQLYYNNQVRLIEGIHEKTPDILKFNLIKWISTSNDRDVLKYKPSLVEFFYKQLLDTHKVAHFSIYFGCLVHFLENIRGKVTKLPVSIRERSVNTYVKLVDSFSVPSMNEYGNLKHLAQTFVSHKLADGGGDATEKNLSFTKYMSRDKQQKIVDKFRSLYSSADSFDLINLIEITNYKRAKWLNADMMKTLENKFLSLHRRIPKTYWKSSCHAAFKLQNDSKGQLASNSNFLDIIYEENFNNTERITVNTPKESVETLSLLLSNQEYTLKKFNEIYPLIINLIENNFLYVDPILERLIENEEFFFENFNSKTVFIFTTVYEQIANLLMNYQGSQDQVSRKLNHLFKLIVSLYRINHKVKFDNSRLSVTQLMANFESCLVNNLKSSKAKFENNILTSDEPENKNRILDELTAKVKLFEKEISNFITCFRLVSLVSTLSNNYNKQLILDLSTSAVRLLSIFDENLFLSVLKNSKVFNINRESILDLLVFYGLFDTFSLEHMLKDINMSKKINENLAKLKTFNENLYQHLDLRKNQNSLSNFLRYNIGLYNMGIVVSSAVEDFFMYVQSASNFFNLIKGLPPNDVEALTKLIYFLNQNLCIKYPSQNIPWLFDELKPLLPVDSNFRLVSTAINSLVGRENVVMNPIFEFNLTSHFEIAVDESNNFINPKSENVKYRIPIMVVNNSYYYDNLKEYQKPFYNYIESFKRLYPLVIINSDSLKKYLNQKDKINYVKKCLIRDLEEYAER